MSILLQCFSLQDGMLLFVCQPAPLLSSTSKPSASELALGKHLVVFNSTCRSWITQAQIPPAEASPTGTSQRGAFPESSQGKMVRLEHGNPAVGWSRAGNCYWVGKVWSSPSLDNTLGYISHHQFTPCPITLFQHRNKKQNKTPVPFR